MSVIVKGMEMPRGCEDCFIADQIGIGRCRILKTIWDPDPGQPLRPYDCPLRPLPEKHGRLIEADSLKETLDYYIREAGWDEKTNRVLGWVKDEFIDAETTIVEAEGEDAGKPRLTLVPQEILSAIAAVREYDCEKSGDPDDWKLVHPQRYRDAMFLHFMAYLAEHHSKDPASGLPHLWHLACNAAVLCAMEDMSDG